MTTSIEFKAQNLEISEWPGRVLRLEIQFEDPREVLFAYEQLTQQARNGELAVRFITRKESTT